MGWSGGTYRKGNYGTNGWTGDASLGIGIEAGRHDTQDDDFQNGINQCLNKDGSNAATGNLNLGANRITNVGAGTARNDAAQVGQVQDSALHWGGTSGGAANAQTLTLSPIITAYAAGQRFSFLSGFTNTAAATLNVNGVGAKNIFNAATGAAIGAGEIVSGRAYEVIYDGTQFLLLNDVTPIQNGDYIWLGTTGGTATAQTATATPAITAYKAGQKFRMLVGSGLGSTGASATGHTLNINAIGAKQIVSNDNLNSSPTIGSWVAGAILELIYDGTYLRIINNPSGWQDYTLTTTNVTGTAPNVVAAINAIEVSRFIKIGKIVTWQIGVNFNLTVGGASTINITPPVNAAAGIASTNAFWGNGVTVDFGGNHIAGPYFSSASNMRVFKNILAGTVWTAGAPNNYVRTTVVYEGV